MKNVDTAGSWESFPFQFVPVPLPMDGWKCHLVIEVTRTELARLKALRAFLQTVSDETGLTVCGRVTGPQGAPFTADGTKWASWSAVTKPRRSPPFDKEES